MTRTPPAPPRPESPGLADRGERPGFVARIAVGKLFPAEAGAFVLLLGTTLFLVAFGLVMVLSSSSVESAAAGRGSLAEFLTQGGAAMFGLPLMLLASRCPVSWWRALALPAVLVAITLQLLVFTGLGFEYGGNRNWLNLGFVNVQPSEVAKLALVLWLSRVLADRQHLLRDGKRLFWMVLPVSALVIGLVLRGGDLGTALVMTATVFGVLFFAGVKLRYLGAALAGAAVLTFIYLQTGSSANGVNSRMDRINSWLSGCAGDYLGNCWQVQHGTWALAAGGIFGVGLGNSKAKWSWLPEAEGDFIFAVIGEELGLIGAAVVLLLFVVLAVAFLRIVQTAPDPFARLVTSAIMVWVLVQAFVNIAVVLQVLPVLGVPLPLISSGGTSLLVTLLAIGVVLSFARGRDLGLRP